MVGYYFLNFKFLSSLNDWGPKLTNKKVEWGWIW